MKDFHFSEENIARLFGTEAAEDEDFDRLQSYYLKNKTHEKVTTNLPLRILVGHKGIGKSAIFTMALHEDAEAHRLSLKIKPDDIAAIGKGSQDFSDMIRAWKRGLVEIVVDKICKNMGLMVSSEEYKGVVDTAGKIISFVRNLFQKQVDEHVNLTESSVNIMQKFLQENRIIVYLDDMDRGWESRHEDIRRISALLNAVRDLSNDNKGLQFRISLRSDVYYLVRTSDESTDKIGNAVVWHSWTNHEILILLIKRIETFFGRSVDIEKLRDTEQRLIAHYLDSVFEKKFTGSGKWENAPTYKILMSLIRKRPRDLVKLCTLAAKNADDRDNPLITTENLKSVFVEYSNDRIQDTINEYHSELPQISRLLFGMKPSRKEIKEGRGYIYDTNRLRAKIRTIQEQGRFLFTNGQEASTDSLLNFMYKINFITARKTMPDGYIDRKFFEENQYLTTSFVNFGYEWEIHPAFRWALEPDGRDIFKKLELSEDDELKAAKR